MELQSAEINEIALALCKAQSTMGAARKDSNNPFFKSKYADLTACIEAVREPFTENDLCFFQATLPGANGATQIITTIAHKSGQWIRGILEINPAKKDPQGTGSAISYGKRYGLQALSGLPTADDDGEAAMNRKQKNTPDKSGHKWAGNNRNKYIAMCEQAGMNQGQQKDLIGFYLYTKGGVTVMDEGMTKELTENFNSIRAEWLDMSKVQ